MREAMAKNDTPYLRDLWYLAVAGARLKPGRTLARTMLGEPLLLGRTSGGAVFALRDICPHRGVPLRYGTFDGREVACCYHGWRFAPDGRCTAIPSLVPGQDFDLGRIRTKAYPCREVQGHIWVYFGRVGETDEPPEVPGVPEMDGRAPQVSIAYRFPCAADHAVFGLINPTHVAFVHTSWWWKKQARKLRPKEKSFEPTALGWRMARHPVPQENRAYRVMGRNLTSEITLSLPGLRMELIKSDRHAAVSLTAVTPINETESEVHQSLYWTLPWMDYLTPFVRPMAWRFLGQDRAAAVKQRDGLIYDPPLMLVEEADTQVKWWARVKREWQRAQAEGRPFANPVEPRTLRWLG
jgi:phenylpropionate dioxygenase-like ring-hydroxylating dioxygenase large terminal subunit